MTALAPSDRLVLPAAAPAASSFAVEAAEGLAAAEVPWRALEAAGTSTPYQRFAWQQAYVEAMAAGGGFAPHVVLVRDAAARVVVVLPLGVGRRQGMRIGAPIGAKHANYHLPLMAKGAALPSPAELRALLREAGRRLGLDAYAFRNLPIAWDGVANPLAAGGRPSPSNGYRLALSADAEATLARAFSKDARKKLRQKRNKLSELGPVAHRIARTADDAEAILDVFLAQKRARFREMGLPNPFEDAPTQGFLRAAALAGLAEERPAIELHALMAGERIAATFGAAVDESRCCGMFTAFDAEPALARTSPGELLMLEVIRFQCAAGRRVFDLGVGEARYKSSLCDEVDELVDLTLPVTLRGRAYAAAVDGALRLKRFAKQTPWIRNAASRCLSWRTRLACR